MDENKEDHENKKDDEHSNKPLFIPNLLEQAEELQKSNEETRKFKKILKQRLKRVGFTMEEMKNKTLDELKDMEAMALAAQQGQSQLLGALVNNATERQRAADQAANLEIVATEHENGIFHGHGQRAEQAMDETFQLAQQTLSLSATRQQARRQRQQQDQQANQEDRELLWGMARGTFSTPLRFTRNNMQAMSPSTGSASSATLSTGSHSSIAATPAVSVRGARASSRRQLFNIYETSRWTRNLNRSRKSLRLSALGLSARILWRTRCSL